MRPGDKIDGYTILRLLGRGGFGEVWLCRSDLLGDYRALKFFASTKAESLDREFQALAKFRKASPRFRNFHLLPVEHVGKNDQGLYYFMPLADGTGPDPAQPDWAPMTLSKLIELRSRAPAWFSCDEIASLMCPVLKALQALASAGFVHRDVKPDNILIVAGQPTLADISLLDEDHAHLTRRGTPGYITPSWYHGGHPDMYGAAATLFTLLTGNSPDRMGRTAFLSPPQGDEGSSLPELARRKHFHAVVRRAVDEHPAERFPDFSAMMAALQVDPPAPAASLRTSRADFLVASFLCLSLAGAALWLFYRESPPPAATKEVPFVNSLGMPFVPVPDTRVLFCMHETRRKDYAAYAEAVPGVDPTWQKQIFPACPVTVRSEDHPVARVSPEDAAGFCLWLSKKERRTYRLPSDREWSLAVGLGPREAWTPGATPESLNDRISDEFPWGKAWPPPPDAGNFSDQSRKARAFDRLASYAENVDDGFPVTAVVMSFAPNHLGLYDMGGNVFEWVEDWWNEARQDRTFRGGSWQNCERGMLLSSHRHRTTSPSKRCGDLGFRIVLETGRRPP